MAGEKITSLPYEDSPAADAVAYLVDTPNGTPRDVRVPISAFRGNWAPIDYTQQTDSNHTANSFDVGGQVYAWAGKGIRYSQGADWRYGYISEYINGIATFRGEFAQAGISLDRLEVTDWINQHKFIFNKTFAENEPSDIWSVRASPNEGHKYIWELGRSIIVGICVVCDIDDTVGPSLLNLKVNGGSNVFTSGIPITATSRTDSGVSCSVEDNRIKYGDTLEFVIDNTTNGSAGDSENLQLTMITVPELNL